MKTKDDVLAKITQLYEKAVGANELGVAANLLSLAADLMRHD